MHCAFLWATPWVLDGRNPGVLPGGGQGTGRAASAPRAPGDKARPLPPGFRHQLLLSDRQGIITQVNWTSTSLQMPAQSHFIIGRVDGALSSAWRVDFSLNY